MRIISIIKDGKRVDVTKEEFEKLLKYGTSEGAVKAWDTRGRGRKEEDKGTKAGGEVGTEGTKAGGDVSREEGEKARPKERKVDAETQHYLDVGWDSDDAKEISSKGVDNYIKENNERNQKIQERDGFKSDITFTNKEQAVLWKSEITGQMSDGVWENSSAMNRRIAGQESWVYYGYATMKIGSEPSFSASSQGSLVGIHKPDLKEGLYDNEELPGRMIKTIRESGVNPNYTKANLDSDIDTIQRAIGRRGK